MPRKGVQDKLTALALAEEKLIGAADVFIRMKCMGGEGVALNKLRKDMLRQAIVYATAFGEAVQEQEQ